jgi:hypothetical protein
VKKKKKNGGKSIITIHGNMWGKLQYFPTRFRVSLNIFFNFII